MKLFDVIHDSAAILEANVAAKIKDPKMIKMLSIAMKHDNTLPKNKIAALGPATFGPEPKDEAELKQRNDQILKLWSDLLDASLRSTDYGDISVDGKFDDWLTRLYINGVVDYEDINGEGGDALGAWKALSVRSKLKEPHQDFNKFRNLRQIQAIVQGQEYRDELRRIKDAEVIEKHKRDRKEVTILDDERFLAVIPMNYGSCYTFNNSQGFPASFCTGSSSGSTGGWFKRYADDGPIISIVDKNNIDDVNGKWQIHAPTNQVNNGNQRENGDEKFAERFPGLMKKLVAGLQKHGEVIKQNSTEIVRGGYDIPKSIEQLKNKFPLSYASEEPKTDDEEQGEDTSGTYLVTHTPTGRTARIPGDNLQDVQQQLTARHQGINLADFTFELLPADQA